MSLKKIEKEQLNKLKSMILMINMFTYEMNNDIPKSEEEYVEYCGAKLKKLQRMGQMINTTSQQLSSAYQHEYQMRFRK